MNEDTSTPTRQMSASPSSRDQNTPRDAGASETTLYFVRHGETEYNRKGIMQGSGVDSSLNDTGREQAETLKERFSLVDVDVIYSSTLRRARQTADVISEALPGVRREVLPDLNEISWGILEGEPPSKKRDAALGWVKDKWRRGDYGHRVENGESILDVKTRAESAAKHLVQMHHGETVVAVTHGRYLRVLIAAICDFYDLSDMSTLGHDNTCVNRIMHRQGRFHADLLNCTAHLNVLSNA